MPDAVADACCVAPAIYNWLNRKYPKQMRFKWCICATDVCRRHMVPDQRHMKQAPCDMRQYLLATTSHQTAMKATQCGMAACFYFLQLTQFRMVACKSDMRSLQSRMKRPQSHMKRLHFHFWEYTRRMTPPQTRMERLQRRMRSRRSRMMPLHIRMMRLQYTYGASANTYDAITKPYDTITKPYGASAKAYFTMTWTFFGIFPLREGFWGFEGLGV
jgi:hypothetical protein